MPVKVFSMKDQNYDIVLKRKESKNDLKTAKITLNTNYSTKTLKHRKQVTTMYNASVKDKEESKLKPSNKSIKRVFGVHERSKSNMKSLGDSVASASEGFKRSLINFKTDLLGLRHDNRYSKETEALVKLVNTYTDKLTKIENCFGLIKNSKPNQETSRPASTNEFYDNKNFIDVISEKDRKYKELKRKQVFLIEQNEKLQNELSTLKKDNLNMSRKLEINNKHEEIEVIFTKLGSLMLANKIEDNLSLRPHERQLIQELFGGNKSNANKILDKTCNKVTENMNFVKHPRTRNEDVSIIDVFGEEEMDLDSYAQSFINSNAFSGYKSRAKKGCMTQRKKKRTKTRDLTH